MMQRRYVLCSRFLNFSVNLQINATHGAGGLSICPVLDIQSVVPFDNQPAFDVVGSGLWKLKFSDDVFADMFIQLQRLFEEGKASPVDTLPNGATLLHVSYQSCAGDY